jgi:hypothetical protein
MVLRLALLLTLFGGAVDAGCLPEGRTPKRVMFEDGQVVEGIRRNGDVLRYKAYPGPGRVAQAEQRWAIYPLRSTIDDKVLEYDWGTSQLPAPADLVPGRDVDLTAQMSANGASPQVYSLTVRLIGPAEVTVAGCRYDVLHLWMRMSLPGSGRAEGERWLDPDRLVVWQHTTTVFGADGKVQESVSARAFAAD